MSCLHRPNDPHYLCPVCTLEDERLKRVQELERRAKGIKLKESP